MDANDRSIVLVVIAHSDRVRIGQEIRTARRILGRSLEAAGGSVGLSRSQTSRIERGEQASVRVDHLVALGAAVGLDIRIRAYPGPDPTLDTGQLRLLHRLRAHLPDRVRMRTEVPLPGVGEQRAWDGLIVGLLGGATIPLDADTRLLDVQAQSRRIALKRRDAGVDAVLWVIAGSSANRRAVDLAGTALFVDYPVSQRSALGALAEGRHPGGSAVILL